MYQEDQNSTNPTYKKCSKSTPISDQCQNHMETSQLVFNTNELTGFYMMTTLVLHALTICCNANQLTGFYIIGNIGRNRLTPQY